MIFSTKYQNLYLKKTIKIAFTEMTIHMLRMVKHARISLLLQLANISTTCLAVTHLPVQLKTSLCSIITLHGHVLERWSTAPPVLLLFLRDTRSVITNLNIRKVKRIILKLRLPAGQVKQ